MLRAYWKSAGNIDTVSITVQADPPVRVDLDAVEIDDVIKNLGEMRVMMRPEHPVYFDSVQAAYTIFNPHWACEYDPALAHTVLHIRDPRYGWLHYVMPIDARMELASALTGCLSGRSAKH
jgi:hypothetical protein